MTRKELIGIGISERHEKGEQAGKDLVDLAWCILFCFILFAQLFPHGMATYFMLSSVSRHYFESD